MIFEIFKVMKFNVVVFGVISLYSLISTNILEELTAPLYPEGGGSMFLQSAGTHVPDYMVMNNSYIVCLLLLVLLLILSSMCLSHKSSDKY
jgi:hypothetical protein